MTIDLDRLETLAKAATPGPWEIDPVFNIIAKKECIYYDEYDGIGSASNIRYIAAANPAAILELIAELRDTRRERDWLVSQRYPQGPGDTSGCPNLERYSK